MASVEGEFDAPVNARTVRGRRDPTLWLPDELIEMIFLVVPFKVLWGGVCECVCRRWRRIVRESSLVQRRKREERWAAYEAGVIEPRSLDKHWSTVFALAVGLDGKIYADDTLYMQYNRLSESLMLQTDHGGIQVWSGADGAYLQTLEGHTSRVTALAVGLDGTIYSGSRDKTIRVWSGVDGAHLQTLEGHTDTVLSLAVGLDGKVYSGSLDCTIRVWPGEDGMHLQTLEGHTRAVTALAVGLDGKIYSGSSDHTIRVWSGADGTPLQTFNGHTSCVSALAVGLDGNIYSGCGDTTIRVWSGEDGTHLHTLIKKRDAKYVYALAVGPNGKIYSGSVDDKIRVW